MAYEITQQDFHQYLQRSPVSPVAARRSHYVGEAARPVLTLELNQRGFGAGNLFSFSADFLRDVSVRNMQDDTMISLHFQLEGNSEARIKDIKGTWDFVSNTHNILRLQDPSLDLLFPTQQQYHYLVLTFKDAFLQERFARMPAMIGDLWEAMQHERPLRCFQKNLPITPALHQALHDMRACTLTGDWLSFYLENKALEILTLQLTQYQDDTISAGAALSAADIQLFNDIRRYAGDHFLDPLSLQGICRLFATNEFKVKKGFKQLFGDTLFQYIHQCKMAYARQQLEQTSETVTAMAYTLGYTHPSHFIAAFNKYFGVRPGKVSKKSVADR